MNTDKFSDDIGAGRPSDTLEPCYLLDFDLLDLKSTQSPWYRLVIMCTKFGDVMFSHFSLIIRKDMTIYIACIVTHRQTVDTAISALQSIKWRQWSWVFVNSQTSVENDTRRMTSSHAEWLLQRKYCCIFMANCLWRVSSSPYKSPISILSASIQHHRLVWLPVGVL